VQEKGRKGEGRGRKKRRMKKRNMKRKTKARRTGNNVSQMKLLSERGRGIASASSGSLGETQLRKALHSKNQNGPPTNHRKFPLAA
jgi:hypothetical protein